MSEKVDLTLNFDVECENPEKVKHVLTKWIIKNIPTCFDDENFYINTITTD